MIPVMGPQLSKTIHMLAMGALPRDIQEARMTKSVLPIIMQVAVEQNHCIIVLGMVEVATHWHRLEILAMDARGGGKTEMRWCA